MYYSRPSVESLHSDSIELQPLIETHHAAMAQTAYRDHALKRSVDLSPADSESYTEALENIQTHQTAGTKGELAPFPTAEFPDKLAEQVTYGKGGVAGLIGNPFIFGAAFLASLGGFSFGYDQVRTLLAAVPVIGMKKRIRG